MKKHIMTRMIALMTAGFCLISPLVSGAEEKKESKSFMDSLKDNDSIKALSEQIDFSKLSMDDLSAIPYSNKDDLVKWATSQADTWGEKLMKLGVDEGNKYLDKMGNKGWQGALKNVRKAIKGVKKSNPETYEAAKKTLASSWGAFQKQASKYLED